MKPAANRVRRASPRGGVRRQRHSLQQQTEVAFRHGLRAVREHGVRQVEQLATLRRRLGVAHRAALAAERFHANVNLGTTLRRRRRVRVRRYQTAGRSRAAEPGRARTAPPRAAHALTPTAAAAADLRAASRSASRSRFAASFGGGDFAVAVVIVVVVSVDVLHLGRAPPSSPDPRRLAMRARFRSSRPRVSSSSICASSASSMRGAGSAS